MADDQLKNLFDYTKFHIGMYTTLTTALLGFLKFAVKDPPHWLRGSMVFTLFCFLVAGAGGGAVASNIPNFKTFEEFKKEPLEVFGIESLKYRWWAHVEHVAFWAGFVVAVTSIAFLVLWPS